MNTPSEKYDISKSDQPSSKKKVGSTELAETLSKFNYNQYLVDKRGWSENELVNFTNESNYAPKVIKKGALTLREYVPVA